MQTMAQAWLFYRLTGFPLALGFLTAARFGPALFSAPLAGLAADRLPRKTTLLVTQTISLVLATLLAVLTLGGWVRVEHLLFLALLQGCVDTLDMTVRHAFQMDLVGPKDLQSAVSLHSAAFNAGRMLGPALAGVIVARAGEGWCFALNAVSYLAVLTSLFLIRTSAPIGDTTPRPARQAITVGLRYVWNTRPIRRVLLAVAFTSTVGLASQTLTPALAKDILHAGPKGYGTLLAGTGVGAILGALAAAAAATSQRAAQVNVLALLGLGLSLLGLGVSKTLPVAVFVTTLVGAMSALQLSTSNAFLQTASHPELRGRVVSLYVWIFQGLTPVGGLAAGWVAQRFGLSATLAGAGLLCALAGPTLGLIKPGPETSGARTSLQPDRRS